LNLPVEACDTAIEKVLDLTRGLETLELEFVFHDGDYFGCM
jgi:hypothetical protein